MEVSLHTCSLGQVLIGSHQDTLYSVELGASADECYHNFINRWHKNMGEVSIRTNTKIVDYTLESIDSGITNKDLQIRLVGTEFQKKVWNALLNLHIGEKVSYKDLAIKIDNTNAVRAIGTACGANPIAVIVPCHRAVRADGKDSGYRWGMNIKKKLLERESSSLSI